MSDDLFDVFNEQPTPTGAAAELTNTAATTTTTTGAVPQYESTDAVVVLEDDTDDTLPRSDSLWCAGESGTAGAPPSTDPRFPSPSDAPTQRPLTGTAPAASMAPPLPLPVLAPASTSSSSSRNGAVMIIRASPASDVRGGDNNSATAPAKTTPSPPASAVFTEPHSRIRVRRATAAFEQLAVRLAEFPYASFALFRQAAVRSGAHATVPRTCVGVVTRKSDPKQNTTQARSSRYAVLSLWSMENISPTPETEVSFLLCGDAFDLLYSQLVRGSVAALSNVGMCPRKGGGGGGAGSDLDVLLRVSDHMSVRQLGFAADLGTCTSVSHKSNERCHAVVNTQQSQHCSYHVGDLRKVARGAEGGTSSKGPSARRFVGASSSPSASSSTAPVMKGGALTSHMTLSSSTGARRADPLGPGSVALRSTAASPSLSSSLLQQHVKARLAASHQLLRQPSFFAVRGATGLPVDDAEQRRGMTSAGTGVYGGVHSGAPLPLQHKVGLRPAERYPSAQELGVTSRGRDVLEAARMQAVLSEEEKLLRRSLRPTEQRKTRDKLNGNAPGGPSGVAGSGSSGSTRKAADANAAATRVRTRDFNSGNASTCLEDVRSNKRTRTEAVPTSTASPRAPATFPTATSAAADAERVAALRLQFQPLHHGTAATFAPLSSQSSVHSVIPSATHKDYRHAVVMAVGGGAESDGHQASTALLSAAAKAAKDLSKRENRSSEEVNNAAFGASSPSPRTVAEELGRHSSEETLSLTLLGAVASGVRSQHDHLRGEADRQRLLSFVDKQITKEKALEALEAVSQQEIKAYYCYGCRCWYAKPPTTCVEQHHRTELKPALKKYIKCEHCHYKTFVIGGDDAKGWKVFPRCPRCHEASFWVRGDAAPQIAGPVEEPTPL